MISFGRATVGTTRAAPSLGRDCMTSTSDRISMLPTLLCLWPSLRMRYGTEAHLGDVVGGARWAVLHVCGEWVAGGEGGGVWSGTRRYLGSSRLAIFTGAVHLRTALANCGG